MRWLLLAGAIGTEVTATLALRASGGLRDRRWLPVVAGGYLLAFVLLGFALSHGMPVGVAYGIWAAAGIALTTVLARALFAEPLSPVMAVGIAVIAVGVLLVELGAQAA